MSGITLDELYDSLASNHEIEFTYQGYTYSIEPDENDGKFYLIIWQCLETPKCLFKQEIFNKNDAVPDIDKMLNEPIFEGSSFFNIEKDIHVDTVY